MPPEQKPTLQPRIGEKVIKPLDTSLQLPPSDIVISPTIAASTPVTSYDPSTSSGYVVPQFSAAPQEVLSRGNRRLCMQHKSLLIFAILVLLSVIFDITNLIILSAAAKTHPEQAGSLRLSADILLGAMLFSLATGIYFLFAKSRSTVTVLLRVYMFFSIIAVFGAFFGVGQAKGVALLIDGLELLYIFILYNIIKTQPAI